MMWTLVIFGVAAFFVVVSAWSGVEIWLLWQWSAVPLGLPAISLAWAIGLGFLWAALGDPRMPTEGDKHGEFQVMVFVRPLLLIGCGWVAKQFMREEVGP